MINSEDPSHLILCAILKFGTEERKEGRDNQKVAIKNQKEQKRKHHAMGFGAPSVLVSLGSRIPKQVPKNLVQILHPNGPICADDLVPRIPKKELPRLSMHRCSWLRPFEARASRTPFSVGTGAVSDGSKAEGRPKHGRAATSSWKKHG